jgi:tRNA 2-thiouridine synthesizing protein D
MKNTSLLLFVYHGTYGRDDDAYGALMVANASLAKGVNTTMVLMEDGVSLGKSGQNPASIGLPNNLSEIDDFLELGGQLIVEKESMDSRGISNTELVDGAKVLSLENIGSLIKKHSLLLTF